MEEGSWLVVEYPRDVVANLKKPRWIDAPEGADDGDVIEVVEWRPLPRWCNAIDGYQVSSRGNVRNPLGHILKPQTKTGSQGRKNKRLDSGGYHFVDVVCATDRKSRRKPVHRLVCAAFYGPPPEQARSKVRHLDGNGFNNRAGNVVWGTDTENWADKRRHGTSCDGERAYQCKLTNEERAHVRWAVQRKLVSQYRAALVLGLNRATIHKLVHRPGELKPVAVETPTIYRHLFLMVVVVHNGRAGVRPIVPAVPLH